ncbi:hypothetical protein C8B47_10825 [filamentous cyanobacterium CCP4]|nr:hypothetical protein C8B47_10825 [filamentous cyanobacterium CCP4]
MAHKLVTTNLDVLRPLMQRGVSLPARMSWESFVSHEKIRAAKVAEYRDYADGEHDVELSEEMKNMLRTESLNLNHCENILETLSDRLRLNGVQVTVMDEAGNPDETATEDANKWVERLTTQWNRLDGMQIDLHDAIPRDGLSFIMAQYDSDAKQVRWTHEEAFDGHEGVIVVWGADSNKPTMAIKIWHETQNAVDAKLLDRVMFNIYFPDRIEKYYSEGGKLQENKDDDGNHIYPWVMADGSPIGVAIVPFVYKGRRYNKHSLGRLEQVIPVQRVVNRVVNSTVMTSENIGFPIRYAFGIDIPTTIKPGTWLNVTVPSTVTNADGKTSRALNPAERATILDAVTKIKVGQIEPAELEGLLTEIDKFIVQMYIVSGTPYPEGAGSSISGEALKQLDIRLVGTAQRCQTSWGNSWEDLVKLSARIESVFALNTMWTEDNVVIMAKWESAEVRDDTAVINNVKQTFEIVPELDIRTRLELMGSIHGWDKTRIDEIEKRINEQKDADSERALGGLLNDAGGFGAFGTGADLDDPLNPPTPEEQELEPIGALA